MVKGSIPLVGELNWKEVTVVPDGGGEVGDGVGVGGGDVTTACVVALALVDWVNCFPLHHRQLRCKNN